MYEQSNSSSHLLGSSLLYICLYLCQVPMKATTSHNRRLHLFSPVTSVCLPGTFYRARPLSQKGKCRMRKLLCAMRGF